MTNGSKLRRLWFAFWDEPDIRRTTIVGGATSIAVLVVGLLFVTLDGSGYAADNYGVLLFFSVAIGYVVATGTYLLPKTLEDLDALHSISSLEEAAFQRLRHHTMHHPRLAQRIQTIAGIGAGITHDIIIGGVSRSFLSWEAPSSSAFYFSSLCTVALWTLMFQLGGSLIRNAIMFARLGREHVRISTFDRRPLATFARTALRPALLLVGVEVAYPLLWIQADFRYVQAVPGFIATVGVILPIFLLPLVGIHRRLLVAKRQTLDSVTSAIGSLDGVLDNAQALIDSEERARLAELVTLRREVEASSSWPIDLPVMCRLGVYLILPPLTWVGAALIENAVEAFL